MYSTIFRKVCPCLELQPPFTSARVPFDCHFCEPSWGWCTPRSRVEAPLALFQPPFTSARVPFDCHFCEPSLGWCTPRSRVEAPLALFQVREVRVLISSLFRTVFALVVDCESVSPKRDETGSSPRAPARKVAQAARSTFERAGNSPRREGSRLSEIPRCSCFCSCALA
ncbi:hypothetical protein DEO72_LG8g1538 [Vigna unguiculata]|uniref:Uncharacterized protein n=1 Tax=Vigna unguiculata TaxID=3917 RepID=A0A4D6MQ24_VIGUN|nr:hypothetical protein DEO72_LG8g1538 [Vigna unguiculata]